MAVQKQHDDSRYTRNACVLGLVVSWFVGIGSLLGGGICLYTEIRDGTATHIVMSHTWREILPLLLNVVVTLLNDSMGYIHSCSLRWALQREGLLEFNSNLRLLRASKYSRPNGMVANAVYLIGIVLAYGSTSLTFLSLNPDLAELLDRGYETDDTHGVHINAIALLTLGAGLFFQATITNWALVTTSIPTWSSNPLDVVRACTHDETDGHRIEPRIGRCMMGIHQAKEDARSQRPSPKQRPMITAHYRVLRIIVLLWVSPILSAAWGGGIQAYITKGHRNGVLGRSWSLLPIFTGITDSTCSISQCTDGTSVLNVGWSAEHGTAGTVGAVFLITAFQSIVTVSLHCAELIVNLSRDEAIYRELIGPKGTNGHYNSVWAAFTSWQTLFLFALKAGVHWIFGLAINLQFQLGVNMYPPQIFYFTAFALVTAVFGLYLSLRRPKGYLPAAYGHIQTMADIIDEWSDSGSMFWGEKYPGIPHRGVSGYTGTSTERLKDPDERHWYGGQKQHDPSHLRHRKSAVTVSSVAATTVPVNTTNVNYLTTTGISPAPVYYYPPVAVPPPPPPQQPFQPMYSYPQWTQQAPPAAPSQYPSVSSLNSAYSGYSTYSNQSTQPFLSGYR
ncbi:hypothetical protein B0H66DRAFT_316708 [Apodospora peruviana]|uniref:Uncharacterized protein n=1 Tax=Apodospora peruviana TaxID=516989 RepID=A0AAE0M0F7_9PEZI|nr:hypothetical protein B0H66DRAFT_316708 [Apodospora peruviana]